MLASMYPNIKEEVGNYIIGLADMDPQPVQHIGTVRARVVWASLDPEISVPDLKYRSPRKILFAHAQLGTL